MYNFLERITLMTNQTARSSRLNMRISPSALQDLRRAAATNEQDVSSFVLGAAMDRARAVMLERAVISLTADDIEQLEKALSEPAVASKTLTDLLAKAR